MALTSPPIVGKTYLLSAADEVIGLSLYDPLFARGIRMETYTILFNDGVVSAEILPVDEWLGQADKYFRGGSDYVIEYDDALAIYDAGFGRWLTEV